MCKIQSQTSTTIHHHGHKLEAINHLLNHSFSFHTLLISSSSVASFSFSQDSTCDLTHHPSFCSTTLPPHYSGSIKDHALSFLHKSISSTNTFLKLISSYLSHQSILPVSTLRALQDCQNLAELNNEFLSYSVQTLQNILTISQAYDLHALLSAILTNHQTCLDGFNEGTPYPAITSGLSNPISDGTKLYGISLALYTRGWISNTIGRSLRERKVIETTMNNRKMIQESIDTLKVREKVVVNPDGSGDNAIMAAPSNTGTNDAYYVIYVVAGIYNEFASID